ncbi:MAG: DUF4373 domain-containing protein [Taibaiella sp.]|jgi:hypothetical protein
MASNKTGFDYYNTDTDRYQDIKIKRLKKDMGPAGVAVYDYILCEIYRVKGCFIAWDDSTVFDVADYWGLKESLVKEIINYCGAVGLFDKGLLTNGNTITSLSIQTRYVDMCKRAGRNLIIIPEEINILTEEYNILVGEYNKPHIQSHRVEESRVKKSKVKKNSSKVGGGEPPSLERPRKTLAEKKQDRLLREQMFGKDLATFINSYTPEMIRQFYDYWREPNKSGTQMKWEMEDTWDLNLRLAKWQRNQKEFTKNDSSTPGTITGPIPKVLI